jgi:hypothetical protein
LIDAEGFLGSQRGPHGGSVVTTGLDDTQVWRTALGLLFNQNFERLRTAGKIITDRARQHEQTRFVRRLGRRTDVGHGAEQDGPQIKRRRRLWHLFAHGGDE